eukprot:gene59749-81755_t
MNDDNDEVSRNGALVFPAERAPNLTAIYEDTPTQEQANPNYT